jgi:hypothetical protein
VLRLVLERGGFVNPGEDWQSIAERFGIQYSKIPESPLWQAFCERWPISENYSAFAELSEEDAVLRSVFVIVYMERDAVDELSDALRPRFSIDDGKL